MQIMLHICNTFLDSDCLKYVKRSRDNQNKIYTIHKGTYIIRTGQHQNDILPRPPSLCIPLV